MGDTLPSVASLRHGRDLSESRAGTSGRSTSLYSVVPHQLSLLAVPPGCESCSSNQNIPRLLLLCCLISFLLLGLQFLVRATRMLLCFKAACPFHYSIHYGGGFSHASRVLTGNLLCRMGKRLRLYYSGLIRSP